MRYLFLLCLFLSGCVSTQTSPVTNSNFQNIQVINNSTLPIAEITTYIANQNIQLKRDIFSAWGVNATVGLTSSWEPSNKALIIQNVLVNPPAVALNAQGYHNSTTAYCSVNASIAQNGTWQCTCGKELIEVIVGNNICAPVAPFAYPVSLNETDGTLWGQEDFVFRNWYILGSPGPWDFRNVTTGPRMIIPGGENEN
jgi:hypothetical protein